MKRLLSILVMGILIPGNVFSQEETKNKVPRKWPIAAPAPQAQQGKSPLNPFEIIMGGEGTVSIQVQEGALLVYSSRARSGIPFSISITGGKLDLRMLVDVLKESGFTQEVILKSIPRFIGEIESRTQVQIQGKEAYRSAWVSRKPAPSSLTKQGKTGIGLQPSPFPGPYHPLVEPADLVMVYLNAQSVDENGYTIKIMDGVQNQGKGKAAACWVTYYLMNLKGGVVSLLGARYIPPLEPNQGNFSLQAPEVFGHESNLPTGDYFLIAVADPEYSVFESNKANNIKKFDGLLHLKNTSNCPKMTPDLFLQAQEFIIHSGQNQYAQTPGQGTNLLEVNRGSQLKLDVYLQNAPHTCPPGLYVWWENKVIEVEAGLLRIDNGNRIMLGTGCVTESYTQSLLMDPYAYQTRVPVFTRCDVSDNAFVLSIPQNIPAGDYWLYILIDPQNKFKETFKNNNLIFSSQIIYVPD